MLNRMIKMDTIIRIIHMKHLFKSYKIISLVLLLSVMSCSSKNITSRSANIDYKKAALLNVELGRNYLAQGYTERAKKKFLHALELMPNLAEAHSGMGYFWEVVGEDKEAEKHYKKSISLGKGSGLFYNQYAVFLCERSRYHQANKNFMLAVNDKLYTKTAEVYNNAGLCSLKYKDESKAVQYFTKALHHDPRRIDLLLELASISLGKQELTLAKHHLDHFYHSNSKPTAAYLWLSIKCAKMSGQEDQAASHSLLLKNLFPNSPEYTMYQNEYVKG